MRTPITLPLPEVHSAVGIPGKICKGSHVPRLGHVARPALHYAMQGMSRPRGHGSCMSITQIT